MSSGSLKRATAALALAAAALLAAPAMAHAVGGTYPPNDSFIDVQPPATVAPGGTVNLQFDPESFTPGQTVSFTLTGENATGASLASYRAAVDTLGTNKAAASDGSLAAAITLPRTAVGTYNLTAATAGWTKTWTFTIAGPGTAGTDTGSALAVGGSESNQVLWLWVGGGVLALSGGGFLVVSSFVKKRRLAE